MPGGNLGLYDVVVSKNGAGSSATSNATKFTYSLSITNISSSTGSIYGGLLLTISGTNFS